MKYVGWVEKVLAAFIAMGSDTTHINGYQELKAFMGIDEADKAIATAIADLDSLTLLDVGDYGWIKETQNTRMVRAGASIRRDLWPAIVGTPLDEEQLAILDQLIALSEQPHEDYADLTEMDWQSVYAALGWSEQRPNPHTLIMSLEDIDMVRSRSFLGGTITVWPTYRGIVRACEKANTEWWGRVAAMVGEWETSTVEFKEMIGLGTEKRNAEFGRDVIALANTKASGRERYIVIGFDDKTREFETPFDGSSTRTAWSRSSMPTRAPPRRCDSCSWITPTALGSWPSSR